MSVLTRLSALHSDLHTATQYGGQQLRAVLVTLHIFLPAQSSVSYIAHFPGFCFSFYQIATVQCTHKKETLFTALKCSGLSGICIPVSSKSGEETWRNLLLWKWENLLLFIHVHICFFLSNYTYACNHFRKHNTIDLTVIILAMEYSWERNIYKKIWILNISKQETEVAGISLIRGSMPDSN